MQLTDKNGNIFGWSGLEIIGPDGKPKTIDQGLTSVGLSMPSAFAVSNSPLTSNGTIGVTGAGTNLEYIDGTGALRTFPSLSGYVTAVTASSPLSSSGGTTPNITISQASGTDDGYLSSTDWLTFNSKQPAGNYITALSGEASGSGPGTASVTLNNASVTAKVLTGVNITGGSISASDSILTAFGKLQNQINGLIGSSVYQGVWNASTNTPALASGVGTRGYYYIVNVAGSTNLDGITDWNVGDWAIFDGTAWQQVDNTDSVTSVNGQTGAVSLTTDNIPEGAVNQYFTQLRARQSLTLSTIGSSGAATYDNTTGVLNIPIYTDQYVGTVTSVDMSVPTGFTISGNPITSAGTLALGFNSDYSLPTIASQLEWDQAYDDMIVSASVTGTTTKTLTLNQQDGGTITASWTDYDTAPVTSVFGRTGDVVAQSGDYTTTLVPEGTNLYYTDARSRAAISSSATGLTYSSGSGVFSLTAGYSIPTTANQSNWTTAYNRSIVSAAVTYGANTNLVLTQQNTGTITASLVAGTATQGKFVFFNGSNLAYTSLNASAPLSFDTNTYTFSISQASGSTNGYLSSTDWNTFNNKQNAITLTTTGTSGPATLIGSTLNIPQYQEVITNPVTGTGTANYVARWTSSSNISTGVLYDNGTNVGIGTASPAEKLDVVGNLRLQNSSLGATIYFGSGAGDYLGYYNSDSYYRTVGSHYFEGAGFYKGLWNSIGQLGIGNTNPTQLVDIGISGAQKSLRVRGTYNFDGAYLSSATSNGGAKIEFVAHTGVNTSSSYRIQHDRDQTPDLIFSYAGSAAAYSSLSYSELMRLDPNANLGLGTSAMTVINGYRTFSMDAPSGTFTEYRQNTVNHMRIGADGGRPFIYCESPNPLDFYTSGAFSMRLAANGNLGLGTTNPTAKLHVWNGKIEVTGYPSAGNPFTFLESNYNDQSAVTIRFLNYNPSNGFDSDLGIQLMNTGGSMFDAMIIKGSTGNLGIGTNTPAQKLEVNGNIKLSSTVGQTSTPSYIWLGNDFSNGATRDKLKIYLYNSGTEQYGFTVGSNADVQYHSNGIHDFYIANSNAVRINSNGHVGIGTTTPSQKLSVIGNIYANGGFIGYRNDGGIGLEVNGGDLGTGSFIAKFNDYNNTSKVVINGVGDVGIGTSTPTKYMSSAETLMSIVNSNVASLYLYSTTGHLYNMSSISNGDLFWYDVSAGTERMRLTASGNFGIGTSSPNVKFEVAGQAFVDKFQYNQGIQISGADLNDVTTAGFYAGSSLGNAPNAGWFYVTVERHSDAGWVHQLATSYGAGNTENEMYSRVRMYASTWMPWKKIAYSSDVPTATSVYDLLPNARVDYTWVGQVVDGTWVDVFTRANNVLTSGTWIVNMYVSDFSTGGAHYTYNYSGTFTWYDGGTNQSGTPAASEIALHRMGHAANNTVLYLRTTEETAADGGDGKFQITGNYSHTSNTTITFKFVKII